MVLGSMLHKVLVSIYAGEDHSSADVLFDLEALLAETLLVEHVVGLVNNEDLQLARVKLAALDNVHAGARRADDDRALDSGRSVDGTRDGSLHNQLRDELADGLDDTLDLTC